MATPIPANSATFTVAELERATGGRAIGLDSSLRIEGVSTDSRSAPRGAIFVALVGFAHDGHAYVDDVRSRGAFALVQSGRGVEGPRIEVPDSLVALGAISRFFVERETAGRSVPIVAIGGAAGKTTTKTLTFAAVSALYGETLVTAGNLNNRIGVPMTLLTLSPAQRAIVLEHGTSERGEIAALARISVPDVGLVVNVGVEHSEGLGTVEEIADEEATLLLAARRVAVTNGDEPLLVERAARSSARKVFFGRSGQADVRVAERAVHADGSTTVTLALSSRLAASDYELRVSTRLLGEHAALNVAAAVAAALALLDRPATTAELAALAAAIGRVEAVPGRLRPRAFGKMLVIDDSYNANPRSVAAALAAAREIAARRGARLVLALGDMLELGPLSAVEHDTLVRAAGAAGAQQLLFVGAETGQALERLAGSLRSPHRAFLTSVEAAAIAADVVQPGDVVLVKGSRGMRMERILEAIEASEASKAIKAIKARENRA